MMHLLRSFFSSVAQTFLSANDVALSANHAARFDAVCEWSQTRMSALPLVVFLVMSIFCAPCFSQTLPELRIESARGAIGTKINIPIRLLNTLVTQGNITLEGQLLLSNSSLLFPESWLFPQGAQNLASRLIRVTDSTYTFAVSTRQTSAVGGDTLAYLRAEILAGSDSVMTVHLRNLKLTDVAGSRMIASTFGTVQVNFTDVSAPFVRFSQLQSNAPNPVQRGTMTRWAYTIDAPSDVVFTIYSLSGEEIERVERKRGRGSHVEEWIPRPNIAAGAYFVRFSTNSGDVVQRLLIE